MIVKNTKAFLHDGTMKHIVKITIVFGNFYIRVEFFSEH